MKKLLLALMLALFGISFASQASYYQIDTEKAHAFIDFRIQHLGFSWMSGRFKRFTGDFSYNEDNPAMAKVEVTIDVASVDTNHAERDKHLRGDKYLNVDEFPTAHFVSTSFEQREDGKAVLLGNFTLHGVTKQLELEVRSIGHGDDPWGGYRRGFVATTEFMISDFGIDVSMLGPSSQIVYLTLSVEGIRRSLNDDGKPTKPW